MLQVTLRSSRATDFDPLSVEEQSEALTSLFTGCLYPAFEAVEGTALVVLRDDEQVTLRHPQRSTRTRPDAT